MPPLFDFQPDPVPGLDSISSSHLQTPSEETALQRGLDTFDPLPSDTSIDDDPAVTGPPIENDPEADGEDSDKSDSDEPEHGSLAQQEAEERRELIEAARQAEGLRQAADLAALQQALQDASLGRSSDDIGDEDHDLDDPMSTIETVQLTQQFIDEIRSATLDNGGLDGETVKRLRNPPTGLVNISDPDIRLSLDIFLSSTNASEAVYKSSQDAIHRCFPDCEMLSFYAIKKLISELSGVVAIEDDMCINSCHAYVGPLANHEACVICGEPRYDPTELALTGVKVPRLKATTFPLGPQLQARR
ncbi:hypothetical protein M378DRAFT_182070 [Amanita muscaria Koide BX008]|uniref:Uncharacterized protein n=1 Tax=Amanita muscaria (strain Koide BX008) TaxID=946122 RepID=A0A0C2W4L4_AMAMK|nr:hypothetical protein M378DRAFT_182070 [Amanita muscaria Koide BX008]